jgi:hypothetical protein
VHLRGMFSESCIERELSKNGILKKQTRVCTMEVSYKEDQINVKPKPKSEWHVFLGEELWVVNEVVDSRMQR